MKKAKTKLLLHACCAPCLTSSYEQVKENYDITVYWFNPNIFPESEYLKRLDEIKRFTKKIKAKLVINDHYKEDNLSWNFLTRGKESEIEGGERCKGCIKYRLLETARYASLNGFDLFSTTLTVSPHKNSEVINKTGKGIAASIEGIDYLETDFKKNDGYKKSIALCKEYDIYRQNYCGCQYSIRN